MWSRPADGPPETEGTVGRLVRTVAMVLAGASALTATPPGADARVWSVRVEATLDGAPFQVQFDVELADPSGSATVSVGRVPVTVAHTADSFTLTLNTTLPGSCATTVFATATAPIQTGSGSSTASGPVTGGQVQSCGGGQVLLGYVYEYPYRIDSDYYGPPVEVPVYAAGENVVLNSPISGSFAATSAGVVPAAQPRAVSGAVTVKTPLGSATLGLDSDLRSGVLVQTGADGNATLVFRDGAELTVAPNSQLTLPPLPDPTTPPSAVTLIKGKVSLRSDVAGSPGAPHTAVKTATVTIRPTGTEFSAEYSQPSTLSSTVVDVPRGTVEVTNRQGQQFTLIAGQRGVFEDFVPRVQLVLPVDRGALVIGRINTFTWTRFPGAAGYLIEYTVSRSGFARPNSPTVEYAPNTIGVFPGTFTEAAGLVEFSLPVAPGLVPPGFRLYWRVFPLNNAGQVLPGGTASDALLLIAQ